MRVDSLDLVGEAHLVADEAAELDAELLRDALGDRAGGDAARLRVRDRLAAELEADLRQLRGLARAGRAGDDHDLVVAEGARDLLALPGDGQLGGVGDRGKHSPPS